MASRGWEFWRISLRSDGALEWLGVTRPAARVAGDRQKVWTLIPRRLQFIANWYVSEDHARAEGESVWVHEWIERAEAHAVALAVPDPSAEQLARLTVPAALETLGRVDRHDVEKLLGARIARELAARSTPGSKIIH